MQKYLRISKKSSTFAPAFREKLRGAIAQLVEQRTENPCVPGSIPGGTTEKKISLDKGHKVFKVRKDFREQKRP